MFGLFFTKAKTITHYAQVKDCDLGQFQRFYHGMLARGVYLAPSAFEAGFVSAAHTTKDIDATIEAAGETLREIKQTA